MAAAQISPGRIVRRSIAAACVNMDLPSPTASATFAVGGYSSPDLLAVLQKAPGFASEAFRVRQLAVWTVADNPTGSG